MKLHIHRSRSCDVCRSKTVDQFALRYFSCLRHCAFCRLCTKHAQTIVLGISYSTELRSACWTRSLRTCLQLFASEEAHINIPLDEATCEALQFLSSRTLADTALKWGKEVGGQCYNKSLPHSRLAGASSKCDAVCWTAEGSENMCFCMPVGLWSRKHTVIL